jgi:serine protease Do
MAPAEIGADRLNSRRRIVTELRFQPLDRFARRGAGFAGRMLVILLVAALVAPSGQALAKLAPDSFADLAAKLLPAVVNISTTQVIKRPPGATPQQRPRVAPGTPFEDFFREFFDRQQRGSPQQKMTSLGSGFVIDPSGLVVTNNHVIAEADEIMITFADETKLKAKVIGRDAKTDLALLKVNPKKPLTAVSFGNSDSARVGDWVVAIGNPFGLGGTVTAGIVSARHRNINSGPYDDFIQTDASINKGNSGGPMFNIKGEVVGVNTAIFSPSGGSVGIGFAIPSNLAKPIIAQLKKFGKAKRGWLGVNIQTVTEEIAEGLGLKEATGALVANITKGSPAEKGKIEIGDVILTFDGKKVGEMRRLPRFVAETTVGKRVVVEVWRKNKKVTLNITLGEFPEKPKLVKASVEGNPTGISKAPLDIESLGLSLATVTPDLREKFKLDEQVKGVIVTKVAEGGSAAEKRIRPGDIIRKIGPEHAQVTEPSQVKIQVEKARESKMKSIIILVERGGSTRFVGLKLEES